MLGVLPALLRAQDSPEPQGGRAAGTPPWADLTRAPVAVITNGHTASSGEALVAVIADRTGHAYGGPMDPDSLVPEEDGRDAPMEAAVRWLRGRTDCSR